MKHLFKSLAEFQQEVPTIHKATQGYGYTYADLPKIFEVINPLLKKHGLGFTQLINGTELVSIVFHVESGETIESKTAIPQGVALKGMNDFQVLGSAITYLRRYALSSILGIVSDKDTDAGGEQVKIEVKNEVKDEIKKVAIDDKRLSKALKAISDGEYTTEELLKWFELTPDQLKNIVQ
jgi:hypothetical protein